MYAYAYLILEVGVCLIQTYDIRYLRIVKEVCCRFQNAEKNHYNRSYFQDFNCILIRQILLWFCSYQSREEGVPLYYLGSCEIGETRRRYPGKQRSTAQLLSSITIIYTIHLRTCVPKRDHHDQAEHDVRGQGAGHLLADGLVLQSVLLHSVLSVIPIFVWETII